MLVSCGFQISRFRGEQRISEPMAIPSDVKDSAAFINDTLRGAAEAIRLAAADLLGTDPRDLRATFESNL